MVFVWSLLKLKYLQLTKKIENTNFFSCIQKRWWQQQQQQQQQQERDNSGKSFRRSLSSQHFCISGGMHFSNSKRKWWANKSVIFLSNFQTCCDKILLFHARYIRVQVEHYLLFMFSPPKISQTIWWIKYICLRLFTDFYLIQPSNKQIVCFDFGKQNIVLPTVFYVPWFNVKIDWLYDT